jgi:hypothetical protein
VVAIATVVVVYVWPASKRIVATPWLDGAREPSQLAVSLDFSAITLRTYLPAQAIYNFSGYG